MALWLLKEEQTSDFFRFFPAIIGTIEKTQLEPTLIIELILKHALNLKSFTLPKLVQQIKLPQTLVKQGLDELRQLSLIEITKGDISFNLFNYQYVITKSGMNRSLKKVIQTFKISAG